MYKLSSAGKRTVLLLLASAMLVWAFAIWTFRSTVGTIPGEEVGFVAALSRNIAGGMALSQLVPALLTLALIVATPLVFWSLLEEYAAAYAPADDGLLFTSIGVRLAYPWEAIIGITAGDEERGDRVELDRSAADGIPNPLLRWLHGQAFGRSSLLIPAGIERRGDLLAEIQARAGLTAPASPGEVVRGREG